MKIDPAKRRILIRAVDEEKGLECGCIGVALERAMEIFRKKLKRMPSPVEIGYMAEDIARILDLEGEDGNLISQVYGGAGMYRVDAEVE